MSVTDEHVSRTHSSFVHRYLCMFSFNLSSLSHQIHHNRPFEKVSPSSSGSSSVSFLNVFTILHQFIFVSFSTHHEVAAQSAHKQAKQKKTVQAAAAVASPLPWRSRLTSSLSWRRAAGRREGLSCAPVHPLRETETS